MQLDWYSATVPAYPERVIERLTVALAGTVSIATVERRAGTVGYATEDRLLDGIGQRVCGVLHGGHNAMPHVRASGHYSPAVASALRLCFPGHSVSRADVAADFDGPDTWEKLRGACEALATERGLRWLVYGDDRPEGVRDDGQGRSAYVGSRSSAVMTRLYEKGKKEAANGWIGDQAPSLDWCRLEIEVKPPNREARAVAATLEPAAFWGCSPWTRELLSRVLGLDVMRVSMTVRKETDARRSLRHMALQYRAAMEALISEEGGDDAALMRFVRETWQRFDS